MLKVDISDQALITVEQIIYAGSLRGLYAAIFRILANSRFPANTPIFGIVQGNLV